MTALTASVVALLLAVPAVTAQDYWSLERVGRELARDASGTVAAPGPDASGPQPFSLEDPLAQLSEVAAFLATLQVTSGNELGGMREGEALLDIVQTDNTTESILVWTRYRALTGDSSYDGNVAAAWGYVLNFPAYEEEGGGGPNSGYYRIYNCGWALLAEPAYRALTGDSSFLTYARDCAQYVVDKPLNLGTNTEINTMTTAWAAGALHDFAVDQADPAWLAESVALGNKARAKAEEMPALMRKEAWALSGGTILWGVLRSVFAEEPGGLAWAREFGPKTKQIDSVGTWRLAHTAWYMLGRHEAWEQGVEPEFLLTHRSIYDELIAADGDDDGGIPTTEPTDVDEDESWVTNYLALMGIDRVHPFLDVAVGDDVVSLLPGETWSLSFGLGNEGALADESALVVLQGGVVGLPLVDVTTPALVVMPPLGVATLDGLAFPLPAALPPGDYALAITAFGAGAASIDQATAVIAVP